jgi:hypothetical protein
MKKTIFSFFLLCFVSLSLSAQSSVQVGDVFTIGEVAKDNYKYIQFPKANIVNKQGGIVNYDLLVGKEVEVTSIKEKKDGTSIATIKLTSGKRFFMSHKYVKVEIDKAIENKELEAK